MYKSIKMRKILSIQSGTSDTMLLVLRIGVAMLMLTHGVPKMMMLLSGGPIQFPPVLGLSSETSLMLAVGAEVFCSLLILTGTATRLAVIPLMITMLVAVVMIHGADPFTTKEPALIYLLVYTTLMIGGSGKYSVDYALLRKTTKKQSWLELSA
jgi:putative oxidoreductase